MVEDAPYIAAQKRLLGQCLSALRLELSDETVATFQLEWPSKTRSGCIKTAQGRPLGRQLVTGEWRWYEANLRPLKGDIDLAALNTNALLD